MWKYILIPTLLENTAKAQKQHCLLGSSHRNPGEIITVMCSASNTNYHKNDVVANYISTVITQPLPSEEKAEQLALLAYWPLNPPQNCFQDGSTAAASRCGEETKQLSPGHFGHWPGGVPGEPAQVPLH